MDSVLCKLGPLTINWFGVLMAMGFVSGLTNWVILGKKRGRDVNYCSDLMVWIIIAGVIGARTAYVVANWDLFRDAPLTVFRVDQGGLIFFGGFAAAGIAVLIFSRLRHENLLGLFDFVITSVPLAHAFGRIGCFMNGCCHGKLYDGPMSVTYPAKSLPWLYQTHEGLITRFAECSLPVHPVQLYEAAYNLAIFAVISVIYRKMSGRLGFTAGVYLLLYPAGRFAFEYLRGDERMTTGPVDYAQLVSMAFAILGMFFIMQSKGMKNEIINQSR